MDIKKLEFINEYFFAHHGEQYLYVVLHSLFNCLSDEEVALLYFDYARGNPELQKSLESYIVKRTQKEPFRSFEYIAKSILHDYQNQPSDRQVRIRMFLSQFIRTLSISCITRYYSLLINSSKKYDRKKASDVADLIWSEEVERDLRKNFIQYYDEISLSPLVDNLNAVDLFHLVENIWTKEFPSARLKSKIIKKLSDLPLDDMSFILEVDPIFYIQVLTIKKQTLSETIINQLLDSIDDNQKSYLIWCIGTSGDWDLLIKYLN